MKKQILTLLAFSLLTSLSSAQVAKTFRSRNIDCSSKQDVGFPAYRLTSQSITTTSSEAEMKLSFEALVCRQDSGTNEFQFVSRKFNDPVLSESIDGVPNRLTSRLQELVVVDDSENILQTFAVENNWTQSLDFQFSFSKMMGPSDRARLARGEKVLVRLEVFLRGIYDFESNGEVMPLGMIGSASYIALITFAQDPKSNEIQAIDFQLK